MGRPSSGWGCLLACILASLVTVGCGVGGNVYPAATSSVTATQHPLVAQYNIVVPQKGATTWVEFGTDTTYGRQTSVSPPTAGFSQPVPILVAGMLPNTTYHMRAHIDGYGGNEVWVDRDQTFTTGVLPTKVTFGTTSSALGFPTLSVTQPNPNLTPQSGVELFSAIGPPKSYTLDTFVTDLQGTIIWYYWSPLGSALPIKLLPNGHFLMNLSTGLTGTSVLQEVDLAGNVVRSVTLDQVNQSLQSHGYAFTVSLFHHDVIALANGHWITLANTEKEFTNLPGYPGVTNVLGDALIDIDPSGNVSWAWSGFDHLDVNRHLQGLPDWTHSNAIVYTPDGNLLVSMRHQSWILKIDYSNGQGSGDILWRLGYQGDFALDGGGNDPSQWFFAQHYPNLLSSSGSKMTLAIFDNGNLRVDSSGNECAINPACYSRATIFDVDESTMTANLDWDYFPGVFSFWGGSIALMSNGDIEFDMSAANGLAFASRVMEVTHTDSPQVVWQLDMAGENAYRAYRIPSLYPGVAWK